MKTESCLVSFEELVPYLRSKGIEDWYGVVTADGGNAAAFREELNERLQNTWWELYWPDSANAVRPTCRYLADSLRDAMRLRPNIPLSESLILINSGRDFFDMLNLWQDEEEEYVECCYD